jgi:hypothetical protein
MKGMVLALAANLVPLSAVCSAAYLAANDKVGWGWFLFIKSAGGDGHD